MTISPQTPGPDAAGGVSRISDRRVWIIALVLAVATGLAYSNTFHVPLLFDDEISIRDNPSIRNLADLGAVLFPSEHVFTSGRPLLNLSFALNYALGGKSVEGYHVVNLVVHILAGLTLLGLVRRTLQFPTMPERWRNAALPVAGVAAGLWLLHPLLTESVTYLSQRAESLMGLFYLLTLYAFARGVTAPEARRWPVISVAACACGVLVKEVMVTAPLIVLLYDRVFASGTLAGALRRRPIFYLSLAATWILLAALITASHLGARGIGYGYSIPWWRYALIETQALVVYLKLALWPAPLVFDYGQAPFAPDGAATIFAAAAVALLVGGIVLLWRRVPTAGFLGAAALLILAPTSSVVPIALQPVAENRMYLSLAALTTGVTLAAFRYGGARLLALPGILALVLGVVTYGRNADYRSEVSIWTDTVAKAPTARAHNNLGLLLSRDASRRSEAIQHYREALRLDPGYAEAEYNLGIALSNQGSTAEAIQHYEAALRLKPDYGAAHNNLGFLLLRMPGQLDAAITHLQAALKINPGNTLAHYNLANALSEKPGHAPEAIREYRIVIASDPNAPEPHANLGVVLARSGDLDGAIAELQTALRLRPDLPGARRNLEIIQAARGR